MSKLPTIRIANEHWVCTGTGDPTRKNSKAQRTFGSRDWEQNGLRRFQYAQKAVLTKKPGKNDTLVLAADFRDATTLVEYKERQVFVAKEHVLPILDWLDPKCDGLDPLHLAEQHPSLFWHLRFHWPEKTVEETLHALGHRMREKRVKRARRAVQRVDLAAIPEWMEKNAKDLELLLEQDEEQDEEEDDGSDESFVLGKDSDD